LAIVEKIGVSIFVEVNLVGLTLCLRSNFDSTHYATDKIRFVFAM